MLSLKDTEKLIHSFVSSRLDYCNALFTCINRQSISRLQTVQNSAARLLTRTKRGEHITPVLAKLHWLPVSFRIDFKILLITYKALHNLGPDYIIDLLIPYCPSRPLRSTNLCLLTVPDCRLATRGDRSFAVRAPKLWNSLPLNIKSSPSVSSFKTNLKTYLYRKAFLNE